MPKTKSKVKYQQDDIRQGIAIKNDELEGGFFFDIIRFNWRKNMKYNRFDINPTLSVDHNDVSAGIVGSIVERRATENGLEIDFVPAPTPKAKEVFELWDNGFLSGLSIWHSPTKDDFYYEEETDQYVLEILESQLVNVSIVVAGRDPESLKMSANTQLEEGHGMEVITHDMKFHITPETTNKIANKEKLKEAAKNKKQSTQINKFSQVLKGAS